jgi:hypothetical protein
MILVPICRAGSCSDVAGHFLCFRKSGLAEVEVDRILIVLDGTMADCLLGIVQLASTSYK